MNLVRLAKELRGLSGYQALISEWDQTAPPSHLQAPLPRAARPFVTAALASDADGPVLILAARNDRLLTLADELSLWDPSLQTLVFSEPNPLFYEKAPWGPRTLRRRVEVLCRLADSTLGSNAGENRPIILATARAVITRSMPPDRFRELSQILRPGDHIRFDRLLQQLVHLSYQPTSVVTGPGQFSRRGGILDVWPPDGGQPFRLDFFGDEIESIRVFAPETQRSGERVDLIRVPPAREGVAGLFDPSWASWLPPQTEAIPSGPPEEPYLEFFLPWMFATSASLLDYLPSGARVVLDDRGAIEDAITEFESQAVALHEEQLQHEQIPEDFPLPYLTLSELNDSLDAFATVDMGMTTFGGAKVISLDEDFLPGPRFGGQVQPLIEHIGTRRKNHETVVLVSRQASRLVEIWNMDGGGAVLADQIPEELIPGDMVFLQGALDEGWSLKAEDGGAVHLLTDAEIFGWARPKPRPRRVPKRASPEANYADLDPGDLVVHVDFGVGRFVGLVQRTLEGLEREYLLVEYGGGGQVYVPVHQADRLTRYVGVEGSEPPLSNLGTTEWERVKGQASEAVEEIARDLLDLYAKRMEVQGYQYGPDSAWQKELEASFPYIETEDQSRAIAAVKSDMEGSQPMDRLICGDVGYGKTEVALRAAFKAVMEGRQVAMLVPTTVLAQQHDNTFLQRLAPFPVEIEMLSRFRTRPEVKEVLTRVASGEVDIVIGTHRLLQRDVHFKDLGLLIIDEEQRFGVTHKEFLKKMRTEVDVLTMTATPIPRTLYMALTGARDISTINTPPEERLPVITHVGRYDPRVIRQAVLRELDRGGQVFFVHNRVQTINTIAERLGRLVPEAKLAIAHGQMPERTLSAIMDRFAAGEIDILVSTSIIESGLDIPNANTLIVDRADTFGLAQLYQLRGRVGRSSARAYAYFLRHPQDRATEEARRRMEIIAENSQLGSGYSIALRDLEMRGAGDILGTRQHGHIAAIGFHLYTRLLAAAVRRMRADSPGPMPRSDELPAAYEPLTVSIELPLAAAIPASYVADRELRLQLYRRMAETRKLSEVEALRDELQDRFGARPPSVDNLLYQLKVRLLSTQAGVSSISLESGQILLRLPGLPEDRPLPELGSDVRRSRKGLWLLRGEGEDWMVRLLEVLRALKGTTQGALIR